MTAFAMRGQFLRRWVGTLATRAPSGPMTSLAALIAAPSREIRESGSEGQWYVEEDFDLLERQGCAMSKRACMAILKGGSSSDISRVHAHMVATNRVREASLCKCLIEGYGRCGELDESIKVFKSLGRHNPEMWSTLLRAHLDCDKYHEAMSIVRNMFQNGAFFRRETYVYALEVATVLEKPDFGNLIHACAIESGHDLRPVVVCHLIEMYATCKMIGNAKRAFFRIPKNERNSKTWLAMSSAFAQQGQHTEVLKLFWDLAPKIMPAIETCLAVIEACSKPAEIRKVHALIAIWGLALEDGVQEALFFKLTELGCLEDARMVLYEMQDSCMQHWEALLRGYHEHKSARRVFGFGTLMNLEGFKFQDDPALLKVFETSMKKVKKIG